MITVAQLYNYSLSYTVSHTNRTLSKINGLFALTGCRIIFSLNENRSAACYAMNLNNFKSIEIGPVADTVGILFTAKSSKAIKFIHTARGSV